MIVAWFERLSLKQKIMASMVCAGVGPLLIAAAIIGWRSSIALEQQTLERIESLTEAKKHELELYFEQIDKQIKFMAGSLSVVEAMRSLKESYPYLGKVGSEVPDGRKKVESYYKNQFQQRLQSETGQSVSVESLIPNDISSLAAQTLYIADNPHALGSKHELLRADDLSSYSEYHSRFHPVIRDFLERFGYYDVFLVEPENGTVVYSVYKEIDFATSLVDGPFKDSNLAEAYRKALTLKQGQSTLTDLASYLPSYQAPAAFVATPVFANDVLHGVLIFQIPVDKFGAITQQAKGMGETGESLIVGGDGFFRSQSRLTADQTPLKQRLDEDLVSRLRTGQATSGHFMNHGGHEVISTYVPLDFPGVDWFIGTEIEVTEALAPVVEMRTISLVIAALTVAFVTTGAWLFAMRTSCRIRQVVQTADSIAQGHFDNAIEIKKGDEIQDLAMAMHRMQTELFGQMREKEVSMNRIKEALDNANVSVMVADADHTIIYLNSALEKTLGGIENELRRHLPNFRVAGLVGKSIDEFHKNPAHQRGLLDQLRQQYETEIKVGSRVLHLIICPVFDDSGERLGSVTQWLDRTEQRATEHDLQQLVDQAKAGVFDHRLDTRTYQGFYKQMAEGLNQTLDAVAGPLAETRRVMESIAAGHLDVRFSGDYQGEFKLLEDAVNTTAMKLGESIMQLNGSVASLTDVAEVLSQDNADLHTRTTQQSTALQETASAMEEITGTVEQNSENARLASQLSDEAVAHANDGNEIVDKAIDSIGQISDSSAEIASIIEIINEIAFQTNLLALNAAVEAARAGEQGRGFAVVASEVRGLAQRSADAAKQIEGLIKDSIGKVERGTSQVNQTGEALKNIVASILKVSNTVSQISVASEEQSSGIVEVNNALTRLESVTQNNLGLVGEISNVSTNLNQQAKDINQAISVFKVNGNRSKARSERRDMEPV